MKLKLIFFQLACTLVILTFVSHSARAAISEAELWMPFTTTFNIAENYRGYGELQPRVNLSGPGTDRLNVRGALIRQIPNNFTIWLGYGWMPQFEPRYRNEHRIWQQVQKEFKAENDYRYSLRFRLEQRNFQAVPEWVHRARLQGKAVMPVFANSNIQLVFSKEVLFFLNTVRGTSNSGFDQSRIFIGANFKISEMISSESGYIFNYVHRPRSPEDRINHVLSLGLALRL